MGAYGSWERREGRKRKWRVHRNGADPARSRGCTHRYDTLQYEMESARSVSAGERADARPAARRAFRSVLRAPPRVLGLSRLSRLKMMYLKTSRLCSQYSQHVARGSRTFIVLVSLDMCDNACAAGPDPRSALRGMRAAVRATRHSELVRSVLLLSAREISAQVKPSDPCP